MTIQSLLLLPRLVVTPPAQLLVVPPQRAAIRRFTAPGVQQLGEDFGRPARGALQLLAAMSNAQARGGSMQMCSATCHSDREVVLAAVQQYGGACALLGLRRAAGGPRVCAGCGTAVCGRALGAASEELRADREVVLAGVQQDGDALHYASAELR